jgi:hypothetical protein
MLQQCSESDYALHFRSVIAVRTQWPEQVL